MDGTRRQWDRANAIGSTFTPRTPGSTPERHSMFTPSPLGTAPAQPATTALTHAGAQRPEPDLQTLLDAIIASRISADQRFDCVVARIGAHGSAINRTVDALAALQVRHEHTDKKLLALQAHQEEAATRIEALEARLAERPTADLAAPGPPPGDPTMAAVLNRLELFEPKQPTPAPSVETASVPTTPPGDELIGRAGPPQRDTNAYDKTTVRIYANTRNPREVVLHERVAKAGVPCTAYEVKRPPLSTMRTVVFAGHETKAADSVVRVLGTLREDDGMHRTIAVRTPNDEPVSLRFFPDRAVADRAKRTQTHEIARQLVAHGIRASEASPRDGMSLPSFGTTTRSASLLRSWMTSSSKAWRRDRSDCCCDRGVPRAAAQAQGRAPTSRHRRAPRTLR